MQSKGPQLPISDRPKERVKYQLSRGGRRGRGRGRGRRRGRGRGRGGGGGGGEGWREGEGEGWREGGGGGRGEGGGGGGGKDGGERRRGEDKLGDRRGGRRLGRGRIGVVYKEGKKVSCLYGGWECIGSCCGFQKKWKDPYSDSNATRSHIICRRERLREKE